VEIFLETFTSTHFLAFFIMWSNIIYVMFFEIVLHECKQGIDQQIFNRKSISRKITLPQSLFK